MLRKIIIIRHGEYTMGQCLTEKGKKQTNDLIPELVKSLMNEKKVLLLSSSAPHAEESAKMLSDALNIPCEVHPEFWSNISYKHKQDNPKALALIKKRAKEKEANIVVLVTNLDYTIGLSNLIIGANEDSFVWRVLAEGEMLILNLKLEKELTKGLILN
ncbi:MAG: hypothetical protein WAV23_02125 [Minisyncoccia bacterium]